MANEIAVQGQSQALKPLQEFRKDLEIRASDIKMALPAGISVERFQRTLISAAQQSPELLKADRRSLILACMKAAQDGLMPDGREAALVIFKQRKKTDAGWQTIQLVQYMPMIGGLRKKILQAQDAKGERVVAALEVGVVYKAEVANGYFRYVVGEDPPLSHHPMLDISGEEAQDSEIVAAYSIATMIDGTRSYELMRRFEIDKIRQMSQTGSVGRIALYDMGDIKKGQEIPPKGPWVDWFPEMAKKTVVRRHAKTLPQSGDIIFDVGSDDAEIEASMSAANMLGSDEGGVPQIEDGGERFDGETGESIDASATPAEDEGGKKKKAPAKAKAKPDQPEAAAGDGKPAGEGAPAAESKDEIGISKGEDRAAQEAAAEKLLAEMQGAATIIDLERIYSESEQDRTSWPDDIYDACASAHTRHQRRLGQSAAPAQGELTQ